MELLKEIEEAGYPTEYLVARICGRSASLITDWSPLIFTPDPLASLPAARYGGVAGKPSDIAWRRLAQEYEWAYLQMDRKLRGIFRPFFTYGELRNLFLALRYKTMRDDERIREVFLWSLLSEKVKTMISGREDVLAAVQGVENFLTTVSEKFSGLVEQFKREGLGAVEQHITDAYLERTGGLTLHPILRFFFTHLIDARNIMSLSKHLRWEMASPPPFIRGGGLSEPAFTRAVEKKNGGGVAALVKRLTGKTMVILSPADVENAILNGLTRLVRKAARTSSEVGLILEYLWRCLVEARNVSIILSGKDMDRAAVTRELVP